MRRQRREIPDLLARLGRGASPPSEHDLRAMARTASSRARPLPRPAPPRRWPLQAGWTGALVVALVVAIGLGVGLGALIAPSGTAARGPIGVGFLPERGWFVLQSGPRSVPGQPAVAIAANVPFHPDDDVLGLAESSALPYVTLQTLPVAGVVIAAAFSPRGENQFADPLFRRTSLPLDVRDAVETRYGRALRDGDPLGQYELRAAIADQNVDLVIYFGQERPSNAQLDEAQRQLDGLVVRSSPEQAPLARQVIPTASARTFDQTLACSTRQIGGIYEVQVRAEAGIRESRSRWLKLPFMTIASPFDSGTIVSPYYYSLAWMTAGRPDSTTTVGHENNSVSVLENGTVGLNEDRCRTSEARVQFTTQGLGGGAVSQLGETYDCAVPRRVLVRVRTTFERAPGLRSRRGFRATNVPILESALAARTLSGKPLVYATVAASGKTRLFTARGCIPD